MNIAFITYANRPEPSSSDALVARWLEDRGHKVQGIPWTEPLETFKDCDLAVVRSAWDYPRKFEQFHQWLDALADGFNVANDIALMKWNSDKQYLFDLARLGFAVPRTAILKGEESIAEVMETWQVDTVVVKPTVGASGVGVQKVERGSSFELIDTSTFLVQEFIPEVANGELSLAFFAGKFSHSVIKVPTKGEFRINSAYGGEVRKTDLPKNVIEQAAKVLDGLDTTPLYARVDGLVIAERFMVFELELIEPSFYFTTVPEGVEEFGRAIERQAQQNTSATLGRAAHHDD